MMKKKELLNELIDNMSPIEEVFHLLSNHTNTPLLVAKYNNVTKNYNMGLVSFVEMNQTVSQIWYELIDMANRVQTDYSLDEVYSLHLINDKWYVQLDPITTFIPTTKFEAERIKPLLTKSNNVLWIKNPDVQKNPVVINSKGEEKPVKDWLSFFKTKTKILGDNDYTKNCT